MRIVFLFGKRRKFRLVLWFGLEKVVVENGVVDRDGVFGVVG